jgi:hypothetical protein
MNQETAARVVDLGIEFADLVDRMVKMARKLGIPRRLLLMSIEEFWDRAEREEKK